MRRHIICQSFWLVIIRELSEAFKFMVISILIFYANDTGSVREFNFFYVLVNFWRALLKPFGTRSMDVRKRPIFRPHHHVLMHRFAFWRDGRRKKRRGTCDANLFSSGNVGVVAIKTPTEGWTDGHSGSEMSRPLLDEDKSERTLSIHEGGIIQAQWIKYYTQCRS